MKPIFRILLIILAVALGSLLVFLQLNDRQNEVVGAVIPTEGDPIGIFGPVRIQFSQPMDHTSVEAHFSLKPSISGRFVWEADNLLFFPDEPFDPTQTTTLSISAGAQSATGLELSETWEWTLTIRMPGILYLVLDQGGGDLWRWDFTTQTATTLTDTGGAVIDFDPDRTGEKIVYAAINAEGGSNLWSADRVGGSDTLLIDCGPDFCSQPVWSADSTRIAYARQGYNDTSGLLQAPQIWIYDYETQETNPFLPVEDINGEMPSFSPDGQWLAFYDTGQEAIRIVNLGTFQSTLIPTAQAEMGNWSEDGQSLIFTDLIPSALEPEVGIYVANLEDMTVQRALAEDSDGTNFSQPQYSPEGDWIAVSLRPVNSTANKALWVLKLDGSEITLVANQPAVNYTAYQWSPLGRQLIYQGLDTGSGSFLSSLWLWDWDTGENQLILDNAVRPKWLP